MVSNKIPSFGSLLIYVVVEHIFELQTAPWMISFLALGTIPEVINDYITVPAFTTTLTLIPIQVWENLWDLPYGVWSATGTASDGYSPTQLFMLAFGSVANPAHLVLAAAVLNNVEANVSFP